MAARSPNLEQPVPSRPTEAPYLGVGVGLRTAHYADVLERGPRGDLGVEWFELISENYMVPGGRPLRILDQVCELAPVVLHGVSLNIGSSDRLDASYLDALAALMTRAAPAWISDHVCWTGVEGRNLHDLLPMPYTDESIHHLAARIRRVQDRLGRRIALENVSSYLTYAQDTLSEWEFLANLAEEADCGLLVDINNIFVSAHNHDFDALEFIDAIPPARIFQIHLAGHSRSGPLLIDTHDHPVPEAVWALYAHALERWGPVSTLIEWDDRIPSYDRLLEEVDRAREVLSGSSAVDAAAEARDGAHRVAHA